MMRDISLGYSPCPNDTYMFHALSSGAVCIPDCRVKTHLHDVETLNRMARDGKLDVSKMSFYAWLSVRDQYVLLDAGAALGYDCGPVLVSDRPLAISEIGRCRVVLPGEWTTAHLLFRLWAPDAADRVFVPYDRVLSTIGSGAADCGVLIHETRFTYRDMGFLPIVDLGQWWEQETGTPIPLGCIAARRTLPDHVIDDVNTAIGQSIQAAADHSDDCLAYMRRYAQEMDDTVLWQHVNTFVNEFSLNLGSEGRAAVSELEKRAAAAGVLP